MFEKNRLYKKFKKIVFLNKLAINKKKLQIKIIIKFNKFRNKYNINILLICQLINFIYIYTIKKYINFKIYLDFNNIK